MPELMTPPPALMVDAIDVSFDRLQILFGVSLDVQPGEAVALLGTNGAGKSTLLRAICGLGRPQCGDIRLHGESLLRCGAEEIARRGVVLVLGGRAVFPGLTVAENLAAGAFLLRRRRALVEERTTEVLELFPALARCLRRPATTLSGGEQQMLALAKAMMLNPDILLIDEFSLGLAPVVVGELLQVVEGLKQRGVTLVIVEQSANVALALADRAVFLEKGAIRFEGPAAELAQRDDLLRAVFLGGAKR